MRSRTILLFIVLTVGISVMQYRHMAVSAHNDIDKIVVGLNGVDSILIPGQSIGFYGDAQAIEPYLWARYVLAPRFLAYNKESDTTLIIQSINSSDSALSSAKFIWNRVDNKYRYLVTVKPSNE